MRFLLPIAMTAVLCICGCSKGAPEKGEAEKTQKAGAEEKMPAEPEKLPEDACERMYACGIDKSCGGSLFGDGPDFYEECAEGEDCKTIVACVEEKYSAVLKSAADKELSDADGFLENCGRVMNFRGPLPKSEAIRTACETLFGAVEKKAGETKDEVMKEFACKKGLKTAGENLGGEFAERYKAFCAQ